MRCSRCGGVRLTERPFDHVCRSGGDHRQPGTVIPPVERANPPVAADSNVSAARPDVVLGWMQMPRMMVVCEVCGSKRCARLAGADSCLIYGEQRGEP